MTTRETIVKSLDNVLESSDFQGLGKKISGKVRESYLPGDGRRVMVATDRISAFDRVLGAIPFKGQVLNQMAAFWFQRTAGTVPNAFLSAPDPNITVAAECRQLPLEFIVRGYLTGGSETSVWTNYDRGVRDFCGNRLPDGMCRDQRFDQPILTPTTKHEEHDRNISRDEAIAEGLIDPDTFDAAAGLCMRLYREGVAHAASRNLILVDTKYELGWHDGRLVVSDEIHTPDSSRYWYADFYEECFRQGREQRKLDKEYVRNWLTDRGFRGEGPPPELTGEVRVEAAARYIEVFEQLTGERFEPCLEPIGPRVHQALARL